MGVAADYNFSGQVANNLIYENANQGILITNYEQGTYTNNTVYEPTGDAVDVVLDDKNVTLMNNILWAQAGYDIKVDPTSEVGFQSDYNDLYTTGTGSVGSWEGQTYATLNSWILELNLDHHSLSVDPQFVAPAGADGVLGYTAAPAGPYLSGSGPSLSGTWTNSPASEETAAAGNGSATATWTFSGLTPGATYQVSTAWQTISPAATDAAFAVTNGGVVVDYQRVKQGGNTLVSPLTSLQISPSFSGSQDTLSAVVGANNAWPSGDSVVLSYNWSTASVTTSTLNLGVLSPPSVPGVLQVPLLVTPQDQGPLGHGSGQSGEALFQEMGYFTATAATATVTLTNYANNSVVAGAAWMQQVVGNGGADDDFHVAPGSPTIDAGNPASPVGQEPLPNGGRINLGSDGGTPQATPSPPQLLQVLSPRPLDKLQVGQQENVTWQTGGLYAPAGYYSGTILADQPLAYYPLNDTSGTVAVDSSGNGLNATYVGGVQLGQPGALPFDPGTAVTLDGSTGYVQLPTLSNAFTNGFSAELWADPTSVGSYQRFFDFGNGSYADNIVLFRNGTSNDLAFTVFQGGSEGNVVVASNAIVLNQWQYFAVTMDAKGNVTLYKNGAVIATGTTYVPRPGIVRVDNYLGKSNFGNALYAGSLDQAAIYAAPLSAAQIAGALCPADLRYGEHRPAAERHARQNIATNVPDSYRYAWTIPASVAVGGGYQVQVTANGGADPAGVSSPSFQVGPSSTDYYVAVNGSDSNSGADPADPMASLSALLTAYPTLGSGDTVHVGPGTYTLPETLLIGAGDSGLTITGPSSGPPAVLTRNNSGNDVIDVNGAANLTLEDLSITGGNNGIDLLDNSNSTGVTVSDCTIYGNNNYGVYIGAGDNFAQIVGNTIYGLPHDASSTNNQLYGVVGSGGDPGFSGPVTVSGNTIYNCSDYGIEFYNFGVGPSILNNVVYACGTGIYVAGNTTGAANVTTISGNTVFNNATGITATSNVNITQNVVYGQSGTGINAPNGINEIVGNTVHDNSIGISAYASGGPIENNIVYHNNTDGIEAQRNTPVSGNTIYGNATGIALDYYSLGPVTNNLIYENITQGVLVTYDSSPSIVNNTVYQPAGDAIDMQDSSSNVVLEQQHPLDAGRLRHQRRSHLPKWASRATTTICTPPVAASWAYWQGQTFLTQQAWFYQIGQDQHSLTVNPQFVNPAGPDGVLGFGTTPIGAAQIIDDSSASGFATTGTWTKTSSSSAENGEYLTTPTGNGSSAATWSFTGLVPGATYQVSVSWVANGSLASDAPFTVLDGSQLLSLTYQNERNVPSLPGTPGWQTLGEFRQQQRHADRAAE